MRVLMVAPAFPPNDGIGPVRNGKVAKWLTEMGHHVRVVTAHQPYHSRLLKIEVPTEHVVYVPYIDLAAPSRVVQGGRAKQIANSNRPASLLRRRLKSLWRLIQIVVHFPDHFILWYPAAVRAADRVAGSFSPDIVYSSSPPFTAHVAARRIARKIGVPWVADFRDLWADSHHTAGYPKVRKHLERVFEKHILKDAAGIVTASPAFTEIMQRWHNQPMLTMTNGYDPEDYPTKGVRCAEEGKLSLVYAGTFYDNFDVSLLLRALRLLGPDAERVRLTFFGKGLEPVVIAASRLEVSGLVDVRGPVPRDEAMALQVGADAFVLFTWTDERFGGWLPAKLFSYLGAQRPILAIGPHGNPLGRFIEALGVGRSASSAEEAASIIAEWLREKSSANTVSWRGGSEVESFRRSAQVAELEAFLRTFTQAMPERAAS